MFCGPFALSRQPPRTVQNGSEHRMEIAGRRRRPRRKWQAWSNGLAFTGPESTLPASYQIKHAKAWMTASLTSWTLSMRSFLHLGQLIGWSPAISGTSLATCLLYRWSDLWGAKRITIVHKHWAYKWDMLMWLFLIVQTSSNLISFQFELFNLT